MEQMENTAVRYIAVPEGAGSYRPGTEQGAEALKEVGLSRQLRRLGMKLAEESGEAAESDAGARANRIAFAMKEAFEKKQFPLVVGGDHSVSVGALAGASARGRIGVIWFDAHGGLCEAATAPGGKANRTPLRELLERKVGSGLPEIPEGALDPKRIVLVGTRDLEDDERELIRSSGITCFTMQHIDRRGMQQVMEQAIEIAGGDTDGIHVSFDMDCLDPLEAPGVSLHVPGGLTYREAHLGFELLAETGRVLSMDLSELNPLFDVSRRTSQLALGLFASLMGKKIL